MIYWIKISLWALLQNPYESVLKNRNPFRCFQVHCKSYKIKMLANEQVCRRFYFSIFIMIFVAFENLWVSTVSDRLLPVFLLTDWEGNWKRLIMHFLFHWAAVVDYWEEHLPTLLMKQDTSNLRKRDHQWKGAEHISVEWARTDEHVQMYWIHLQ